MKFIEQSAKLLASTVPFDFNTKQSGFRGAESLIEIAGRTCYQSQDLITPKSTTKFIKMLKKREHLSVLEHPSAIVRLITNRGVTHELVRHRLASYCLSKDTKILRYNQGRKHLTVEKLYERQQNGQLRGRNKLMMLRSMNDDLKLVPNKFKQIIYSGIKDVYEVTTSLGYKIKTSMDHVYFSPTGEIKLKDLNIGDEVYINGIDLIKDREWLSDQRQLGKSLSTITDTIIDIQYIGKEDCYDIEMCEPFHNFVANGFVVHNSQESTRYVKYDGEMEFIKPVWFEESTTLQQSTFWNSCKGAETDYKMLLEQGWRPEQAREVLPNALKTEIVMSANFREWLHAFALRTSKAAHPQIRDLMLKTKEIFINYWPTVFGEEE